MTRRSRMVQGNVPRARLTPGDQSEVEAFAVHLKEQQAVHPTIVCICGSMRFQADMARLAEEESLAGGIVVMPHVSMATWERQVANADETKHGLDLLHRAKIRLAAEILVVGDHLGDSTRAEIEYARYLGTPVRFTNPEVDPARAE